MYLALSGGVRPSSSWNINPSLGFTRVDDLSIANITNSYLVTLTAEATIIPEFVTFFAQGAYTDTKDDDRTVDNWNFNGLARLTFWLEQFFFDYGRQRASVRINYDRTLDRLNSANSTANLGVFFVLDVLFPVPVLPFPEFSTPSAEGSAQTQTPESMPGTDAWR